LANRWSLLILRECFPRKRRFEAFEASLGITRHVLADRLKKLVRFGVLRRIPYQESPKRYEYIKESPKRYEYILTQKSLDLYPIIISIVDWGNIHMVDSRGRPMLHQHKNCGHMFDPVWFVRYAANDWGGGPGVAHHRVQGWYRPCAQSFGELGCKGAADAREARSSDIASTCHATPAPLVN
jgi:DNA-binding HxlR family transcriptional regulator